MGIDNIFLMDIVHSIKQELNETRGILIKSYEKLLDQSKKLDELEYKNRKIELLIKHYILKNKWTQ